VAVYYALGNVERRASRPARSITRISQKNVKEESRETLINGAARLNTSLRTD